MGWNLSRRQDAHCDIFASILQGCLQARQLHFARSIFCANSWSLSARIVPTDIFFKACNWLFPDPDANSGCCMCKTVCENNSSLYSHIPELPVGDGDDAAAMVVVTKLENTPGSLLASCSM